MSATSNTAKPLAASAAKPAPKPAAKPAPKPAPKIGTTGHAWDGIRELNTPLPRWWLWLFYLTIIWSIGYWVVYPAWPLVSSFTTGTFGWNSRGAVATDLNDLKALRAPMNTKLAATALADIKADQ